VDNLWINIQLIAKISNNMKENYRYCLVINIKNTILPPNFKTDRPHGMGISLRAGGFNGIL